MESKAETFTIGSSLQVPYVEELAKNTLAKVPSRYVRFDQNPPTPFLPAGSDQVPVIDLEKLLSDEFMDSELDKIHDACKQWGFFQLINHGVNLSLVEKIKSEFKNFIELPIDEKKKFSQKEGDVEGFGQIFVKSEHQKLDWSDILLFTTFPVHLRRNYLLPAFPPPLRDAAETYSIEMKNLSMKILNFIAKSLKTEYSKIREVFEPDGWQLIRMNYYPPCPQPELVVGISPHSDGSGLTILLQANETEGLQIKKDGKWVSIKPLPNAFVINIGDILEIMTNGIYRSIEHRAIVDSEKERLSVATFWSPRFDAEIGPLPSLVTPETPALFKTIKYEDYIKGFFNRELGGKSYIDSLRINKN